MKNDRLSRLVASLLLGVSVANISWVLYFVASQSKSVFRNFALSPSVLLYLLPIGILIGGPIYLVVRRSRSNQLTLSVFVTVIVMLAWWLAGTHAVQQYIMPEATIK